MIPVCPKCHVGLMILRFKEIEVDFCEKCRGIWLDAGELEDLMKVTGARADDPLLEFQKQPPSGSRRSKFLCPRCDRHLREITVSRSGRDLVLERCPGRHGLWFDDKELKQLLEMFPPEAGAGKTVDYLNDLFGAQKSCLAAKPGTLSK